MLAEGYESRHIILCLGSWRTLTNIIDIIASWAFHSAIQMLSVRSALLGSILSRSIER